MDNYINKNAIFKELLRQHAGNWTYTKVADAFDGKGKLSTTERVQLTKLIDQEVSKIKENIKKS
jgi:hypothetical protein